MLLGLLNMVHPFFEKASKSFGGCEILLFGMPKELIGYRNIVIPRLPKFSKYLLVHMYMSFGGETLQTFFIFFHFF